MQSSNIRAKAELAKTADRGKV